MSLKSKIVSSVLLILLIVPIVGAPLSQTGKVLGVSEDRRTTISASQGEIGSGVLENKTSQVISSTPSK